MALELVIVPSRGGAEDEIGVVRPTHVAGLDAGEIGVAEAEESRPHASTRRCSASCTAPSALAMWNKPSSTSSSSRRLVLEAARRSGGHRPRSRRVVCLARSNSAVNALVPRRQELRRSARKPRSRPGDHDAVGLRHLGGKRHEAGGEDRGRAAAGRRAPLAIHQHRARPHRRAARRAGRRVASPRPAPPSLPQIE